MKKIKVKDVPSVCPKCGGWLAEAWCRNIVSLECIGNDPDSGGCGWSEIYELLPTCKRCRYYRYDEKLIEYENEDGEKITIHIPTNERCMLHNRPTTWDDYCENYEEASGDD